MNIVKELRKKKGIQQKELAISIGVSRPTVSEWEQNKKDPSGERLKRLSEFFGVDELVILGKGIIDLTNEPTEIPGFLRISRRAVPVIGGIACGELVTAEQNVQGYADLPDGIRADFALRCNGDSMSPTFRNGDLVLVRQQPDVEDGQIAVVLHAGEATLKRVYHKQGSLLLVADNPVYPPITIDLMDGEYTAIQGLAVGYTRLFYESR